MKINTLERIIGLLENDKNTLIHRKSDLLKEVENLVRDITELNEQIDKEGAFVEGNPVYHFAFAPFLRQSKSKIEGCQTKLHHLIIQVANVDNDILNLHIEVKKFQRLKEKIASGIEQERQMAEAQFLDLIGQNRYIDANLRADMMSGGS